MAKTEFLYRSEVGISYYLRHEADGSVHLDGHQDVQHILDHNGNQVTHNDGWNADKSMRRAASIPIAVLNMWKQEGFDALRLMKHDPKAVAKRLNSSDWQKLRTADWNM